MIISVHLFSMSQKLLLSKRVMQLKPIIKDHSVQLCLIH